MGGIGKTELAIQYCYKHFNLNKNKIPLLQPLSASLNWVTNEIFKYKFYNYPGGIYWINAREQNIGSQIIYLAYKELNLEPPEKLELVDQVNWIWKHWRRGKTLVVLDDVKNYSDIKPYLPPEQSQFKILITTRLNLEMSNPLDLKVLSEKEALKLLTQLINSKKVQQELETAKKLCQRLGYLPIALQLVGRYIKKHRITLTEELERLKNKGLIHNSLIVKEKDPTWTLNINRGVAAAFELSWEELSEPAQQIGCLLSLFALAPIPWSLVENATTKQDSEKLENTRVELENLHLLQSEKNNYKLHQLIQEFFQTKQRKLAIANEQKSQICITIAKITDQIPERYTLSDINYLTPFIPHLIKTANSYQNWLSNKDLVQTFTGLGKFYQDQGAYKQALPWYQQCLSIIKKRLGEEHPDVANILNKLASLYEAQGRYSKAELLHLKALKLRKKLLGEEHPDVAESLNNLAGLYDIQGKYSKAEALYLQALKIGKKTLGEEHSNIRTGLNNLALVHYNQGKYSKAEALYLQALKIGKKTLGEEHPNIANTLNNLALLYDDQGKYKKAEALHLQALEMRKELLGKKHPDVATSLNNLAGFYNYQGKYKKAEALYLQALEMRKELLGKEHPSIATSLNNLAGLYYDQGKYKKAEPLYLKALEMRKSLLGEEHPDIATSLNNLALLYYDQERYKEAESLYLKALEIREKLLEEENPSIATSLNDLALLYESQNRYEEAKSLYLEAIKIAEKILGNNHSKTITIKENYKLLINSQN